MPTPQPTFNVGPTLEGALIELFELYLPSNSTYNTPFGSGSIPDYRFCNITNEFGTGVWWGGNQYFSIPVEASGFEFSGNGKLPRPGLKIANVDQWIGTISRANSDLINSKIIRIRTYAKYLDAANFINGNPNPDPSQTMPPDIYYVDRKVTETKLQIEWELAAACDISNMGLPGRQFIPNTCTATDPINQCPFVFSCDHTLGDNVITVGDHQVYTNGCRSNWSPRVDTPKSLPFYGFPGCGG